MKLTAIACRFPIILAFFAHGVTSQQCQADPVPSGVSYPNCTQANTGFCEGGSGDPIIFRCFYPYGHACPGNCMDNLDENYRDAACWESAPGAGDGQCAAQCVSVTAKNGSTFYPFGCDGSSASSVTAPLSTTTSSASASATSPSPARTSTSQTNSASPTAKSGSTGRLDTHGIAFGLGCILNITAYFAH